MYDVQNYTVIVSGVGEVPIEMHINVFELFIFL